MLSSLEFKRPEAQRKVDDLWNILTQTITAQPLSGEVEINQVADYYGYSQGEFPADGFYKIRGFRSRATAGDIMRAGTYGGERTFWYPANVGHLKIMLAEASHRIGGDFGVQGYLDYVQGRATEQEKSPFKGRSLEGAAFGYADQKEREALARVRLIDFGTGDGAMPLLASMFEVPAIGVDIDPELLGMARQNKIQAQKAGLLGSEVEFVEGSFFDEVVLSSLLASKDDRAIRLLYMSVIPITERLITTLLPYLRVNDYILTYRERLSEDPEKFLTLKDKLEVKTEVRPFFSEHGESYGLYRVKS